MTASLSAPRRCRIVILISGSGSNLQAFIDAIANGDLPAEIAGVVSNRADAFGLERARQAHIPTTVLDHKLFASREDFDAALQTLIDSYQPDLLILAGFMRILTAGFVRHFHGRLLNIHPSLLPKYPGLHTHQRALDAGDSEAGATVHFVTEELDGGPAIVQVRAPIIAGDTATTLAQRILQHEHAIYPLAAQWFAEGRLVLRGNRAELDGKLLPPTGVVK
ncbi:MAG: phosphoribosylglycinamide formyltransferase [Spongiibacteraceae bacterium]